MPYRNPIITAKMLVTLDVLSGGRVILGAGVGWMPEEFATLGASYEHRGGVTDEYIQIFRELCTADKPSFEGKHYQIANLGFFQNPCKNRIPRCGLGAILLPPCAGPSALGMAGIRAIYCQRRWPRKPSPCGSSVLRLAAIPPA